MQAQDRFVHFSTRPVKLGAAALMAFALALLVLVILTGSLRSAQPAPTGTLVVSAHQQAPDTMERNDAFAQALAARYNDLTPDARERNEQLAK
jgi:hypothetical protein